MAVPDWLQDSRHPTLWVNVVYPLLIFLPGSACNTKTERLLDTLRLAPVEPAAVEADEDPTDYTATREDDLISPAPTDTTTEKRNLADTRSSAEASGPRVPVPADRSNVNQ